MGSNVKTGIITLLVLIGILVGLGLLGKYASESKKSTSIYGNWAGTLDDKTITHVEFMPAPPDPSKENSPELVMTITFGDGTKERLFGSVEQRFGTNYRKVINFHGRSYVNASVSRDRPLHALRGTFRNDTLIKGKYGTYLDENASEFIETGRWHITK